MSTTLTSKGQVTIPKHVRQKLGIRTGSRVSFRLVGDFSRSERRVACAKSDGSCSNAASASATR